jgi:N utilization substance protein A
MRLKAYIIEVRKSTKEPQVVVSRTHPGLVRRLFELEVPEIQQGIVEIRAIAREPGYRTKIAVYSKDKNVDPVGACVGPKGSRVKMVVHELRGEKIDVIPWNENPAQLIANALSPAKVNKVRINETEKTALVIVPDDQLSLAIGREGQNARLAAKLTGWKVDIKSESQLLEEEEEKKKEVKEKEESHLAEGASSENGSNLCQALTSKGAPCKNKALSGSKFCRLHQGYKAESA